MPDQLDWLQKRTEVWREQFFKPLLRHFPFHPHDATTFRLLLALSFPFLITINPDIAWIFISISIILDAFDGTVARYKKIESDRGKFIDVLVDEITFVLLCLGLIRLLPELNLVLTAGAFSISLLYVMAMVHKNEKKPSDWLIKPQARLTIYKIIFLVITISYIFRTITLSTTYLLLWSEVIVATVHFFWHYYQFVE